MFQLTQPLAKNNLYSVSEEEKVMRICFPFASTGSKRGFMTLQFYQFYS